MDNIKIKKKKNTFFHSEKKPIRFVCILSVRPLPHPFRKCFVTNFNSRF